MSSSKLQILIQASVQGIEQLKQFGQQISQTEQLAQKAGQAAGGAAQGFAELGGGASSAGGALSQLVAQGAQVHASFTSLLGVVKVAVAAFAAFVAISSLKGAADIAARNETLGVTLGIVGKNAGYSSEELGKYEKEVEALGITTQAARNSLIQMIQAGLRVGPMAAGGASQISLMARAAQDLAVVTGENSSVTLQKLIVNIQQMDTMGLRFMGIVVDMDEAVGKYAETTGKAAGALTRSEKQQALLNATMEKAKGMQGAYVAAMDTVGKKLFSMQRLQEEASASIGKSLLPAYAVLVDSASAFLKKVKEISDGIAENGKVAQVLKDILVGVFNFAGEISSAIIDAIKSIIPALESTFSKLTQAFQGVDTGPIVERFKLLLGYVVEFGVTVISAIGDAAPSIRLLYDAFEMVSNSVFHGIKELVGLVTGMNSTVTAGEALSVVIQSLGFLVAGFADGISVIKAVAELMFSGVAVIFGALANVIGDLIGLVDADLGQSFKRVGDVAIEMGMKSAGAFRETMAGFMDGDTYVHKYLVSLEQLPAAHEADAAAAQKAADATKEAYGNAEELVRKYVRAVNDGALSGSAAAEEYKKVVTQLGEMAKTYDFTQVQIEKLNNQLKTSLDKAQQTTEAFKALGVSSSEFGTQVSAAGTRAVEAFNQIVQSGVAGSEELYRVFNKALSMETSLAGLTQFRQALDQAFKDGKIKAEEYGSAVQLIGIKFEDLLDKQLKLAHTKEDFQQLTDQVQKLGSTGAISGQQVSTAMSKIGEAASGAREQTQRLAQQQTALAEASTRLAQADLNVTRANIDVQRAKNTLIQAEANYRREGTALARQEVEVARIGVQLAEQKARLAVLQRQQESDAMNVLIAQQQLLNAEKDKELHIGDASAQAAVDAAQKELGAKQLVLEDTNQAVAAQQENVAQTQAASDQASALAENMRGAADQAKKMAGSGSKIKDWVRDASGAILTVATITLDEVIKQFRDMGMSLEDASKRAKDLTGGMRTIVAYGTDGVNMYRRITKGIEDAKQALKDQETAAQEVEDTYGRIKDHAEEIAAGVVKTKDLTAWNEKVNAVAEAYRRIRKDATDAATAAKDAARSFADSMLGIHEELLRAQGQEVEATKLQYDQKRRELALEYQLLQVKIKAAIVTAQAAGVDTGDLQKSLRDVSDAYAQAVKDLKELESLSIASAKKKQEEDRKAAAEAKARADEEARQAAGNTTQQNNAPSTQVITPTSTASQVGSSGGNTGINTGAIQSIATSGQTSGSSGRTVTVNFTLGNIVVPTQVAQNDEARLLDLLQRARSVA